MKNKGITRLRRPSYQILIKLIIDFIENVRSLRVYMCVRAREWIV
jgi:hypothetical protein